MKYLSPLYLIVPLLFLASCEPNKELYEELDSIMQPYNRAIEYTLNDADYSAAGGVVANLKAFTAEKPAMDYVPGMLARKFIALNLGSSAVVNYQYYEAEPLWLEAGFGYELTAADYTSLGLEDAFSPAIQAKDNLPSYLLKKFRDVPAGTRKKIVYDFREGGSLVKNIDTYEYDGEKWNWLESREDIPYVGYELETSDYEAFGGELARFRNFSDNNPAHMYIPIFLKNAFPYATEGTEQVVKYKVFAGGSTIDEISHYTFDGVKWTRSSDIVPRSEQYVFGAQGWAFDPTTRFIMTQSDYMYLAVIDPIPHAIYADFGYYYGASAFYSNFDMRLIARRVSKNTEGSYWDAELGAIYDNEGPEATVNEMYRRIVEEGIVALLQHKYPQAVPQSGGIDVHYIIGFETFNDNFSRSYLESEYQCIAAATGDNPPQFKLIEGPRQRQ
jgi:hypothetical protein